MQSAKSKQRAWVCLNKFVSWEQKGNIDFMSDVTPAHWKEGVNPGHSAPLRDWTAPVLQTSVCKFSTVIKTEFVLNLTIIQTQEYKHILSHQGLPEYWHVRLCWGWAFIILLAWSRKKKNSEKKINF